jgi:hypothetical protein
MTSITVNISAGISLRAARLALGTILAYQTLLFVLIFRRPDWIPPGTQSANGRSGLTSD